MRLHSSVYNHSYHLYSLNYLKETALETKRCNVCAVWIFGKTFFNLRLLPAILLTFILVSFGFCQIENYSYLSKLGFFLSFMLFLDFGWLKYPFMFCFSSVLLERDELYIWKRNLPGCSLWNHWYFAEIADNKFAFHVYR